MALRTRPIWIAGACAAALASLSPAAARADVSSWFFVGGGPSWMSQGGNTYELRPSMQIDLGLGSAPSRPIIVGGLARVTPHFGMGTDLALVSRVATQGFVVGNWGAAIDAGGYQRWWGRGSTGFTSAFNLGLPYGLTVSFNASMGSDEHRTFSAFAGIDLLRLTVYRLGGEKWWYNPRPAWRPDAPSPTPQQP